jgi:hypothetical protein
MEIQLAGPEVRERLKVIYAAFAEQIEALITDMDLIPGFTQLDVESRHLSVCYYISSAMITVDLHNTENVLPVVDGIGLAVGTQLPLFRTDLERDSFLNQLMDGIERGASLIKLNPHTDDMVKQ